MDPRTAPRKRVLIPIPVVRLSDVLFVGLLSGGLTDSETSSTEVISTPSLSAWFWAAISSSASTMKGSTEVPSERYCPVMRYRMGSPLVAANQPNDAPASLRG